MAYEEYENSGKCLGKVLRQLSVLGVPIRTVSSVIQNGVDGLTYNGNPFATYKWNEINTPIFIFHGEFENLNRVLKQPPTIMLMGSINNGESYVEAGVFTDTNSLLFKEKVHLFSKTYLADINGIPLKEQTLNNTSILDKLDRLKNKFENNFKKK